MNATDAKCVCGHYEIEHEPTGDDEIEPSTGELVPEERCRGLGCRCRCFDEWTGEKCDGCGQPLPWRLGGECPACLRENVPLVVGGIEL